jgi:hypothetical protein
VRARLDHFNAAQNSMNAALAEMTRERDALRWDATLNARVAAVSPARTRDPPALGGFGRHTQSLYGDTPGSGVSADATSATPATSVTTSVMIQGSTKHLSDHLTSGMIRVFRLWVMTEAREGRSVFLRSLISPAAQRTISGRFRLCAEQPGFLPEFPDGARGDADDKRLRQLAADPNSWWLLWSVQDLLDRLVRAFPSERNGSTISHSKTLEELLSEISLRVNPSDRTPLARYMGAVQEARELAAPKDPSDETRCVKLLLASFGSKDADNATYCFNQMLDVRFAGKPPTDIDTFLVDVDREYMLAAAAHATAKAYAGTDRHRKRHFDEGEQPGN